VFEVFDTHPDNRRSLFGGGRYDNLVGLYSAQPIPGFGFGMGDVTLFDFLGTHGLLPEPRTEVDAVVIATDAELTDAARSVAKGLRGAGVRTSTPLDVRKLGKEIQRADKSGARVVVIIGGTDWAAGTVTVRDLHTGDQQQVSPADAPARVRELLEPRPGPA
jgi:histidyl-tRNA synthetase